MLFLVIIVVQDDVRTRENELAASSFKIVQWGFKTELSFPGFGIQKYVIPATLYE